MVDLPTLKPTFSFGILHYIFEYKRPVEFLRDIRLLLSFLESCLNSFFEDGDSMQYSLLISYCFVDPAVNSSPGMFRERGIKFGFI